MRAEHRHQRPLQRLVDRRDMLGGHAAPSAPATAAASRRRPRRRIRRPSRSTRSRTCTCALPVPATCSKRMVWWPSQLLGEVVHAVAAAAGVEHVGHQHGVVVGLHVDAAPREDLPVEFQVLADLEHAGSSSSGLIAVERVLLRDLVRRRAWPPARTGRCRPARRPRGGRAARSRPRCRPTASEKPHSCACIGSRLVVSVSIATTPMSVRARDPGLQPVERAHGLVFACGRSCWPCAAARCAAASAAGVERRRWLRALARGCRRRCEQVAARAERARRWLAGVGGRRRARQRRDLARRQLAHRPRSRWRRCRTSPRRAASAW